MASGVTAAPLATAGHLILSQAATQQQQAVQMAHPAHNIRPTILSAPTANVTVAANPAVTNPGIPQLATLPSGLTGHLVQIGQQTYLVPHSSMLSIRPPGAPSQQPTAQYATAAHLVSAPTVVGPTPGMTLTGPATVTNSSVVVVGGGGGEAKPLVGGVPITATAYMPAAFQKTQVDGRHDSEDEDQRMYYASTTGATTPGSSAQPTPLHQPPSLGGGPLSTGDDGHRSRRRGATDSSRRTDHDEVEDDEEEDEDDDDDFFVPATPGFAPPSVPPAPSSGVSAGQHHRRGLTTAGSGRTTEFSGATPLSSGPGTPATPMSTGSTRLQRSPRRSVGQNRFATTPSKSGGKRRRRSSYGGGGVGDTDSDEDDDYDDDDGHYDVGDDVELMTNATMTPAVDPSADSEDEDEDVAGTPRAPELPKKSQKRRVPLRSPSESGVLSPSGGRPRPAGTEDSRGKKTNSRRASGLPPPPSLPPPLSASAPGTCPDDGDDEQEGEEENEEPLNSGDDVSDEEPEVLFESQNVIVCQYDKIHRSRNRWRFHLKDGIMAIKGRDHIFQKAVGEAEW